MDIFRNKKMAEMKDEINELKSRNDRLSSELSQVEKYLDKEILKIKKSMYYEVRYLFFGISLLRRKREKTVNLFYNTEEEAISAIVENGSGVVLFRGKLRYYKLSDDADIIETDGGIPYEAIRLYNALRDTIR